MPPQAENNRYISIDISHYFQSIDTFATPAKHVSVHSLHIRAGTNTFNLSVELISIHTYRPKKRNIDNIGISIGSLGLYNNFLKSGVVYSVLTNGPIIGRVGKGSS